MSDEFSPWHPANRARQRFTGIVVGVVVVGVVVAGWAMRPVPGQAEARACRLVAEIPSGAEADGPSVDQARAFLRPRLAEIKGLAAQSGNGALQGAADLALEGLAALGDERSRIANPDQATSLLGRGLDALEAECGRFR